MSSYVISDLHGCLKEFCEMLELIGFSDDDKMYVIGDVVDRGPDSIELLQKIMSMKNVTMLMGNHEHMMTEAIRGGDFFVWGINRGDETYKQFCERSEEEQKKMLSFLNGLPLSLDLNVGGKSFHLVHACPSMGIIKSRRTMLWERPERDKVFFKDKTVVVGHTPTCYVNDDGSFSICRGKNMLHIDCGCFFSGILACVRLDDLEEFYIKPEPKKEAEPDMREFIVRAAEAVRNANHAAARAKAVEAETEDLPLGE